MSLQCSAIFNSLWIGFTCVIPGLTYMVQTQKQTASTHMAMMFDQQQYMHDSWYRDKAADFEQYLQDYAQLGNDAFITDATLRLALAL